MPVHQEGLSPPQNVLAKRCTMVVVAVLVINNNKKKKKTMMNFELFRVVDGTMCHSHEPSGDHTI